LFALFSYWFLNYFLFFFQIFDKLEKKKKVQYISLINEVSESAGQTCWLPFYFLPWLAGSTGSLSFASVPLTLGQQTHCTKVIPSILPVL
jgi:hypothetical protein